VNVTDMVTFLPGEHLILHVVYRTYKRAQYAKS
jgi:hypothetical protein